MTLVSVHEVDVCTMHVSFVVCDPCVSFSFPCVRTLQCACAKGNEGN